MVPCQGLINRLPETDKHLKTAYASSNYTYLTHAVLNLTEGDDKEERGITSVSLCKTREKIHWSGSGKNKRGGRRRGDNRPLITQLHLECLRVWCERVPNWTQWNLLPWCVLWRGGCRGRRESGWRWSNQNTPRRWYHFRPRKARN